MHGASQHEQGRAQVGGSGPWSIRNTAMYLVDSDFDTEDEAYGDDIEEVISSHDEAGDGTMQGGGFETAGAAGDLDDNFFSRQAALTTKINQLKQFAMGGGIGSTPGVGS